MALKIVIDRRELDQERDRLTRRLRKPRPLMSRVHTYLRSRTAQTARSLAHGGTFRGVTWPAYKPQYRRKTDGALVPAWGGTPKVHGSGAVQGRRRGSGRRITTASNMLVDTGRLLNAAQGAARYRAGGSILEMSVARVPYAKYVLGDRPLLFFDVPRDLRAMEAMTLKYLES